jgi:hypothetical protein
MTDETTKAQEATQETITISLKELQQDDELELVLCKNACRLLNL